MDTMIRFLQTIGFW